MENENHRDFNEILSQRKIRYEEPLNEALSKQLDPLFANLNGETWAEVRKLLAHETESAVSKLLADISGLELDTEKSNEMVQELKDYGRHVVERKAREEAGKVKQRMEVRFASILSNALVKRKQHKKTTKEACIECLKLLSVMVAIRLDEKPVTIDNKFFRFFEKLMDKFDENTQSETNTEKYNKVEEKLLELSKDTKDKIENMFISHSKEKQEKVIENMLISSLIDEKSASKKALDSSTWPEVSPKDTLITPGECMSIWEYFLAEILPQAQAFTTGQEATKARQMNFIAAGVSFAAATT